jgi:hypothetical protein
VLFQLRATLIVGGTLIVAVPNVLHWRQRLTFLRGVFRYSTGGIMDSTHLRFYDWEGARALLAGPEWEITRSYAVGHAPGVWRIPRLGVFIDRLACRLRPGLFGDQFVIVAKAR